MFYDIKVNMFIMKEIIENFRRERENLKKEIYGIF